MLSTPARSRIQHAFGTPVLDNYAAGECPFLSNGCPIGPGMHINADWAILEVVDDDCRPVPPGHAGKRALLTNLANTVQPIIRYEIGDVITMADNSCDCGSRLPRIDHVEGRACEEFWVSDHGIRRPLGAPLFKNACDYVREIRDWQAIHEAPNRIRLRLELLPGKRYNETDLRRMLTRQLLEFGVPADVDLSIEIASRLKADPVTGKLRRMIDYVKDRHPLSEHVVPSLV